MIYRVVSLVCMYLGFCRSTDPDDIVRHLVGNGDCAWRRSLVKEGAEVTASFAQDQ